MRKNASKRIAGIAVSLLACASLITGCAGAANLNTPVAVVNDENITFGVAKFYAKTQQVMYESSYGSLFGDNMWDQALGEGVTFGQSTLQSILEELKQMYVVAQHADEYEVTLTEGEKNKIEETAKQFVADNSKDALEKMGADEAVIKEYLTKYTIKGKIEQAIKAGADINVSDEDAAQKTLSYVFITTSGKTDDKGNTVELTEEEKAQKKIDAQAIIDEVASGKDFDTVIKDGGRTVSNASFGKDDNAGLDDKVIAAASALQEGEVAPLVEVEGGYYVIKLTSAFDEEQTQSRRQEIIKERQNTLYQDTYTKWEEASKITVDDKVWKKINFNDKLTIEVPTNTDASTVTDTTQDNTTEETVAE